MAFVITEGDCKELLYSGIRFGTSKDTHILVSIQTWSDSVVTSAVYFEGANLA